MQSRADRRKPRSGPSRPLAPEAFRATPVTCLGGIRVQEGPEVLRSVSEAQGFRGFKPYVRKVNLRMAPEIRGVESSRSSRLI